MVEDPELHSAPAAAETAEREAERRARQEAEQRYPESEGILGYHPHAKLDQRAFVAGATWQREQSAAPKWCSVFQRYCNCDPRCENHHLPEQSALSGGERAEVLRLCDLIRPFLSRLADYKLSPKEILGAFDMIAARLRSAPSEAEPHEPDYSDHELRAIAELQATSRAADKSMERLRETLPAAPSPAPEQRAGAALRDVILCEWRKGASAQGAPNEAWAELAAHAVLTVQRHTALPAPAADTVAVPRETLRRIVKHHLTAEGRYLFAAEITRLLGETP